MFRDDFSLQKDVLWLNAASEGPLPAPAARALEEAVVWKSSPQLLTLEKFASVPIELKKNLGTLMNVPHRDVILGNSASYGLHLLANGFPFESGDEVIVMKNDFPVDILPWLDLERRGVVVRQLSASDRILSVDELLANLTPRTRIVCLAHVHSFSGKMIDWPGVAEVCRSRGIDLILNLSQSLGSMPLDVSSHKPSAIVCAGYKWLCGPYGTGFCWIDPELRDRLVYNQANWLAYLSDEELTEEGELIRKDLKGARRFDVFGTANFFNFVPLRACVDYFLSVGLQRVERHIQSWIDVFLNGLSDHYVLISERSGKNRSALVVFSHTDSALNPVIHKRLTASGIHTALWKNNIRISPHVYNTVEEVGRLLEVLNAF